VNAVLPGLMETPMVLNSAGLAAAYGGEEELWKARGRAPISQATCQNWKPSPSMTCLAA
jgi:hypothetical protein